MFFRKRESVFQYNYHFTFSPAMCECQFLHIFGNLCYCLSFLYTHLSGWEMVSVVFIHIFLMSKEWRWESFHVLIGLLIVSLDKCVFKSFVHFLNLFIYFFGIIHFFKFYLTLQYCIGFAFVHFWIGLLAYFISLSPLGGKHCLKF